MSPQHTIAHYRIVSKLGEGGMGEVWRATDTKLNRDVAIKILLDGFAVDPDRLARFTREAQVLASLNHPNIAAIYGVEDRAIVMELIEGRDLPSPLPLDKAVPIAIQICEALEYAHDKGIVHRDLKPANIKLTPDGRVKVLDFGLARALSTDSAATSGVTQSPTLTMCATQAGVILGTAAYMAPEQARGRAADRRADIFAFGCVLYELLTGSQAFSGASVSDILAAVLKEQPDLASIPPHIRPIVEHCLRKDPRTRWQSIGDVRIALEEAAPAIEPTPVIVRKSRLPWIAAAVFALATAALAFVQFRAPALAEPPVSRTQILLPDNVRYIGPPAISPDGRRIAFPATTQGKGQIWLRDLDSLALHPVPGTDGGSYPSWSPDGRELLFFSLGFARKVEIAGGPPLQLLPSMSHRGGTWNREGVLLFGNMGEGGIESIPATGGPTKTVIPVSTEDKAAAISYRYPYFLPDGRHFLFLVRSPTRSQSRIDVGDLQTGRHRELIRADSNASYTPQGYLLFAREGSLYAQPFDPSSATMKGQPVLLAKDVQSFQSGSYFSVSATGALVYSTGASSAEYRYEWLDRAGKHIADAASPGSFQWFRLSPDGHFVADDRMVADSSDIWLHDLDRETSTRLTTPGPVSNHFPVWSSDGRSIAWLSVQGGKSQIHVMAADGAGGERILVKPEIGLRPDDWSPDGKYLVLEAPTTSGPSNLWVYPLDPSAKPYRLLNSGFREHFARVSPDGHWVLYQSDRSGRLEIYVTSFPTASGQVQISTAGGVRGSWSPDAKEIFYVSAGSQIMSVAIKPGQRLEPGIPKKLFEVPSAFGIEAARDGRVLIASPPPAQTIGQSLVVLQNWTTLLK